MADINDWQEIPADQINDWQEQPQQPQQPQQQGVLSKGVQFATHFPQSAIDLVPGMKERRLGIQEGRKQSPPMIHGQPMPEPVTGMEDPAYAAMGLSGEAPLWALGKLAPQALKKFLKPAAERSEVLSKVKNVAELEPYVQGKVNQAAELFNKKQISPRMLEQESRMAGNTVKLDPKSLEGLSPEIDMIAKSLTPDTSGLAELPATEALKLRAELNKISGWKASPMDPSKAKALDTQASAAHQNLAEQFSNIDPAMAPLSQELQQAYTTQKQAIGTAGKNPIQAVTSGGGAGGLAKQGRLARFDEQAGTNLKGLGENIQLAQQRLEPLGLETLLNPKKLASQAGGLVGRPYDALAEMLIKQPEPSSINEIRRATALFNNRNQGK